MAYTIRAFRILGFMAHELRLRCEASERKGEIDLRLRDSEYRPASPRFKKICRRNRAEFAVAALGAIGLLTFACDPAPTMAGQSNSTPSPPVHGSVENGAYIDPRFGLQYSYPDSLDVLSSLNGMPVGTGQKNGDTEYLFAALGRPGDQARRGVFITSVPVGELGLMDVSQFMRLTIGQSPIFQGKVVLEPVLIANRTFYRSNSGGDSPARFYGAQLGTSCSGQFLVFWFSAASAAAIDRLVHSMDGMKLTCPSG